MLLTSCVVAVVVCTGFVTETLSVSQADVPQFIVFTADDAIQSYTLGAVNQFLAHRKNPNGCQPVMSYYTSLVYTNYTLVTDWYVAGNEIGDHTYVVLPSLGFWDSEAGCSLCSGAVRATAATPVAGSRLRLPSTYGFLAF